MSVGLVDEQGQLDAAEAGKLIDKTLTKPEPEPSKTDPKQPSGERPPADAAKEPEPEPEPEDRREEAADGERPVSPWMTSKDVRDLAESLGLTKEDLADFDDEEQFNRAVRLLDKQLRGDGLRSRKAEPEGEAKPEEGKAPTPAERAAKSPRDEQGRFLSPSEAPYAVQLDPELYDDEIVGEFRKLSEHYDGRIRAMEQVIREAQHAQAEVEQQSMIREFDSVVDRLDVPELFGKGEEVTPEQREKRGKVWVAMFDIMHGAQLHGKPAAFSEAFVRRAFHQEFADYLKQQERRALSNRIQAQSRKRLGVPSGRAPAGRPYEGPMEKHPDLLAAYYEMERENGARS